MNPGAAPSRRARPRLPLTALVFGSGISFTGNVLASVAIPWFVLSETGSASLTGVAAFASTVPIAIGSLFAGRAVDILGPKRASVASDLVSAASVAAIPAFYAAAVLELWHLFVLTFAGALFDATGSTARQSLIPVASQSAGTSLERGTSLHGSTEHVGYLLGAPLAGVLIAVVGAPGVLWLDAASFVISALLIAFAVPRGFEKEERRPAGASVTADDGARAGLREAVAFMRRDGVVLALVVSGTLASLLINALAPVVLPVFAQRILENPVALGILVGGYGVGGLLGMLVIAAAGERMPRRLTYASYYVIGTVCYAVLALIPPFGVLLAAVFIIGLTAGLTAPIGRIVRLERSPPQLRPRVLGITTASWMIVGPIAVLGTGALIDLIGLQATLAVGAVGQIVLSGYVLLHPAMRRLEETRPPHAVAPNAR